jgi:hypothetical protein
MDSGPGWLPDPEDGGRERYWSGSDWTDRVRPAGKTRSLRLPDHVPELQRALAGATADIDAVEDRLSTLFDRTDGAARPPTTSRQQVNDPDGADAIDDDRDAFAEFDAALAAEVPEDADVAEAPKKPRRGLFRRRS